MNDLGQVISPTTLRIERLLPGPIERLWAYLTEPAKRAQWFAGGPIELRAGGHAKLFFQHRNLTDETPPERYKMASEGIHSNGIVTRCEPPHVLAFSWGEGADASEVLFELTASGKEVRLVITHSRLPSRAEMVNVGSGWHLHLDVLEDLLHGRPRRPFWATQAKLAQQYEAHIPR